jgi:hypothetical protein
VLKLSSRQFETLQRSLAGRFRAQLEDLVFTLRPELREKVTPPLLEHFFEVVLAQSGELGFTTEFEHAVFVAAVLLQGRDFHLNPQHVLHQVVNRPATEPRLRAVQLLYELERMGGKPHAA